MRRFSTRFSDALRRLWRFDAADRAATPRPSPLDREYRAALMPPLIFKGDAGINRPIIIDGSVLTIVPASIDLKPEPVSDYQDMLDSTVREWQRRPHFAGIANYQNRYTADVTFGSLNGENRILMEETVATGGTHRLVIWRMIPMKWTCIAGLQRYYFPQLRGCAAWIYDGLAMPSGGSAGAHIVDTESYPTFAEFDGDELAVTYAEGPTLATPGAGGIVISRQPDASGSAASFTAFMLGDVPTGGEVVKVWMAPSFEMSLRAPQIRATFGQESHSYTFVEL